MTSESINIASLATLDETIEKLAWLVYLINSSETECQAFIQLRLVQLEKTRRQASQPRITGALFFPDRATSKSYRHNIPPINFPGPPPESSSLNTLIEKIRTRLKHCKNLAQDLGEKDRGRLWQAITFLARKRSELEEYWYQPLVPMGFGEAGFMSSSSSSTKNFTGWQQPTLSLQIADQLFLYNQQSLPMQWGSSGPTATLQSAIPSMAEQTTPAKDVPTNGILPHQNASGGYSQLLKSSSPIPPAGLRGVYQQINPLIDLPNTPLPRINQSETLARAIHHNLENKVLPAEKLPNPKTEDSHD